MEFRALPPPQSIHFVQRTNIFCMGKIHQHCHPVTLLFNHRSRLDACPQGEPQDSHSHTLATGIEFTAQKRLGTGIFKKVLGHCLFCTWQVKILVRLFRLARALSLSCACVCCGTSKRTFTQTKAQECIGLVCVWGKQDEFIIGALLVSTIDLKQDFVFCFSRNFIKQFDNYITFLMWI